MRLYLIRHADPDYEHNTITAAGHLEAKALAEWLEREKVDQLYCSSMQRAIDTMRYTAERTGLSCTVFDWMREVEWEDTIDNYQNPWDLPGEYLIGKENVPDLINWKDNPNFDGPAVAADLKCRTDAFDAFLLTQGYERDGNWYFERHSNLKSIAMFCHAGFANAIFAHLMNIPLTTVWADFWMAPSSVTKILFTRRESEIVTPRCIAYGDTSHLYAANLEVRPRGLKGSLH